MATPTTPITPEHLATLGLQPSRCSDEGEYIYILDPERKYILGVGSKHQPHLMVATQRDQMTDVYVYVCDIPTEHELRLAAELLHFHL